MLKHFLAQSISFFIACTSMARRICFSAASSNFSLLSFVNFDGQFFYCQRNVAFFCFVSEFLLFLKNQQSSISNAKFPQRESGRLPLLIEFCV